MHQPDRPPPPWLLVGFIVLFGVLLPFIALGFVQESDFLRYSPFSPVPNAFYIVLVALVPLTNAFVAVALWRGETTVARPIAWLHTFALAIACAYTFHLAPLVPLGILLIQEHGFGFLLLSPFLALVAASMGRKRLQAMPPLWAGMAMGVFALFVADFPSASTRIGLSLASSTAASVHQSGLFWVRHLGSDEILASMCRSESATEYGAPGDYTLSVLLPVSKEQAQAAYQDIKEQPCFRLP